VTKETTVIDDAVRQVVREAVLEALAGFQFPTAVAEPEVGVEQSVPRAMSVVEAARQLGLSRSSLYTLIADGRLPTLRIGKRRLVLSSAIEEFLAGQSEQRRGACRFCGAPSVAAYRRESEDAAPTVLLCSRRGCHERLVDSVAEA
jgi:excisionase family DNA binding protein